MEKEKLIISLLKSKVSIDELLNINNLYDNEISDIRRIDYRLRDILLKKIERKLKISFMKQKIKEIFQKKKEKKMRNISENQ